MSRAYLRHMRIDRFGALSDKALGPFGPGLNVVFGPNEAGKTSVASFVEGVLFGWRDARGSANTYRPANAERCGSLFFQLPAQDGGEPAEAELSRARNADGLQGDASLVADIDKETFRTMFFLTSDELRSLRNTTDVTARLLTAGSGTGASPAHALAEVDARLAAFTSRAAGAEESLTRIAAEKDELRAQIAQAAEEAERFRRQDREFADMGRERDEMKARLAALNDEIEKLTALLARVEKLDAEMAELQEGLAALAEEEDELLDEAAGGDDAELRALAGLAPSEERALRDLIDDLAAEEAKCQHAVDLAQDNCANAKAAHEALVESERLRGGEGYKRRQMTAQVSLSLGIPVVFVLIGVLLFIRGVGRGFFSYEVLGAVMVVLALAMAAAAVAMLLKPARADEARKARLDDSQWVMLQDSKKLEACIEARDECRARTRAQLDAHGLAGAHGSTRQARELLDEARELRAADNLLRQRRQALTSRRAKLQGNLAKASEQRRRLFEEAPYRGRPEAPAVEAELAACSRRREELLEASEAFDRRYGELKQELSQAKGRRDFAELKQRYQQLQTREDESARALATLLLARRILESAIASWESKSQPEVYRRASRLLGDMTAGRWTTVEMTEEGGLRAVDAVHTRRDPAQLSLGTCQQLYLALRIALLLEADNVGRAVPILADDILVNFDADRRAGAARALSELAGSRQVILFTCHEEVVRALREASDGLTELRL